MKNQKLIERFRQEADRLFGEGISGEENHKSLTLLARAEGIEWAIGQLLAENEKEIDKILHQKNKTLTT